jgi:phage repressor protein C with HTH and peptisase S24 domain
MFYDNLKAICDKKGVKITPLVAECGGAKGSISNWKKGAAPNSDIVLKLAVRLNVSTDYLLKGLEQQYHLSCEQNDMLNAFDKLSAIDKAKVIERAETLAELAAERAAEQEKENKTEQNNVIGKCLPLNGTCDKTYYSDAACAGTGLYLDEASAETLTVRSTPEALAADFAIPISGDSMEDEYHDGDIVLVESCPCVRKGEVGIFLIDGDVCIKKYGGRFLISYNKNYKPIDLSKHETVVCFGKVIGIAEVVSKTHF